MPGSSDIGKEPWRGYDILGRRTADLKQAGILMPRSTAETVLDVSVSTALTLWTTEAAVFRREPEKKSS